MSENSRTGQGVSTSKVGRKPAFDEKTLSRAAIQIGLADVTITNVAKQVGVRSSALYRLVDSRDDLVCLAVEQIAAEVDPVEVSESDTWQDILHRWADSLWDLCEKYEGFSEVIVSVPGAFLPFIPTLWAISSSLNERGLTNAQSMFALDVLGEIVVTQHRNNRAMRKVYDSGESSLEYVRRRYLEYGKNYPDYDMPEVLAPKDTWKGRTWLDMKLNFIIEGLEHRWPTDEELKSLDK